MKPSDDIHSHEVADEDLLAQLIDQISDQLDAGQSVELDELVREYPEHEERLRKLLPAIRTMARLGHHITTSGSRVGALAIAADHSAERDVEALGEYEIVGEIGRGGMGIVYRAKQKTLRRDVALKVLPLAALANRQQIARFHNEARAAAALHHPHIVPIHSVGVERGIHYYAMEYIEGPNLAQVLEQLRAEGATETDLGGRQPEADPPVAGDPPSAAGRTTRSLRKIQTSIATRRSSSPSDYFRTVARWGLQAGGALAHAHAHSVVHRDIKPSNLLLDEEGQVWITDFGLARLDVGTTMTVSGDLLGTLPYMSPEQVAGKGSPVDHRTDVYSLGVTLYEALTLRPPFLEQARGQLLQQIERHDPPSPCRIDAKIPVDLDTIVRKAMEKNPADRYHTATDMAEDLERFLDSRPIHAARPSLADRAAKWLRRHRAVVGTAVVSVLVMLIIGMVLVGRAYQAEKHQREVAQNETTEAERERARAEAGLRLAREAVDDMYVTIVTNWLANETAPSSMQKHFLERALEVYQQLAEEPIRDQKSRQETAMVYQRMATIHRYLERPLQAVAALEKSVALTEELWAHAPDNSEYRATLADRCDRHGVVLREFGKLEEAEQAHAKARQHIDVLLERFPDAKEYRQASARYLLNRALVWQGMDRDAEKLLRQAKTTYQELVADDPGAGMLRARMDLVACGGALAVLLCDQGQHDEAEQEARAALEDCTTLRQRYYHDVKRLADLEVALTETLAKVAIARGHLEEAAEGYDKALALRRAMFKAKRDPLLFDLESFMMRKYGFDEAYEPIPFCGYIETQLRLAVVLRDLGRFHEAEQTLGECAMMSQIMAESERHIFRIGVACANSWAEVALLLASRRPVEAEQARRRAAESWQDLKDRFDYAADYRSGLRKGQTDLAWFHEHCAAPRAEEHDTIDQAPKWNVFDHRARGRVHYRAGGWKAAIGHFGTAAKLDAEDHLFDWLYLALAHAQLEEWDEARQWLDKAEEDLAAREEPEPELLRLRDQAVQLLKRADATPDTENGQQRD